MIYSQIRKQHKGNLQLLYAKLSANLIHFFGISSLEKQKEILSNHLLYKEKSYKRFIKPQKYLDLLKLDADTLKIIEKSQIIYSYCIGEYRILPILLNQLGYDVTILMSGRIEKEQSNSFLKLKNTLNKNKKLQRKIRIISSDEDNVIWKLKSNINEESKLLIFVDGNTGLAKKNENLIMSTFFSQSVLFYKGISYLSHMMSTTPVGITLFYNDNSFNYNIFNHQSCFHLNKNDYCKKMTDEIFFNLSNLVMKKNIAIWDTLGDVYKWLDLDRLNLENFEKGEEMFLNGKDLEFNSYRYTPFFLGKEYFIFDKKFYDTYVIQKKDYEKYIKYVYI